jgi:hypothetical protein
MGADQAASSLGRQRAFDLGDPDGTLRGEDGGRMPPSIFTAVRSESPRRPRPPQPTMPRTIWSPVTSSQNATTAPRIPSKSGYPRESRSPCRSAMAADSNAGSMASSISKIISACRVTGERA